MTPTDILQGAYFDANEVELDIAFIESLTLTKSTKSGKPEPFNLFPVHRKLVANLLGWKRSDGRRLYRKCYFSTGRKNAKTQITAAVALLMLVMDTESEPEIYIAAKDLKQSSLVFEAVASMVRASEELSSLLTIVDYQKTIINRSNGGKLCALSSDGKGKHGYNPSFVIFDEYHTFDASEQELNDALTTGSGLRREPCFVIITTAGVDEYSLCGREYDYAKKVLNGTIVNPSYLPLIYELPKDANWCDETLWHLANPILGLILDIDFLREEKQKALDLPSEQTKFRRLYMNQWVNSKSQWIPVEKWDLCKWDGEPIAA